MKSRDLKFDKETVTVKAEIREGVLKAQVGDELLEGPILRTTKGAGIWKVNGDIYRIVAAEHEGKIWASINGRVYVFEDTRSQDEMGGGAEDENSVSAPMPGKVIKVMVAEGDTVEEGQACVIVEAMKMEHILRAPIAGVVKSVDCAEGQHADPGVPLVQVEES